MRYFVFKISRLHQIWRSRCNCCFTCKL